MTSNNKKWSGASLLTLLAVAVPVGALLAADTAPKALMHERHEHYEQLGEAFKKIRDESRAGSPDMAGIKQAAKIVNDASVDQARWFPKGTGPEAGKTRAKAEIWAKPQEFTAAQKVFSDAAPKLLAAANGGDIGAVRDEFGAVGKSCKNCHDTFRTPDK